MGGREEIRKQIDEARDAEWFARRLKALSKVARGEKESLTRVLAPLKQRDFAADRESTQASVEFFERIGPAKLGAMWDRLFPRLAPHIHRVWDRSVVVRDAQWWHLGVFPFRVDGRSGLAMRPKVRLTLAMSRMFRGLDPDAAWVATYAPHLGDMVFQPLEVGRLLGAALRGDGREGEAVRRVLIESINGEHEIGVMGQHAITGLLHSDDRQDWEVIGKLLLAAQRQEGLRQSILAEVHRGSEGAFRYMLGLILEHNLGRFSATVQSFDMWLGTQWAGGGARVVHQGIERLCRYLDDDSARRCRAGAERRRTSRCGRWASGTQSG
jgi:hypothetical protein